MTQPKLTIDQAMQRLQAKANPKVVAGSAHFGLKTPNILGVPLPEIRAIAKDQRDHELAGQLWQTGIHEARLLASMVEDPSLVTEAQMDTWVKDFDNWGVCDGVCNDVFKRTPFAFPKAIEWCQREEEFEVVEVRSHRACVLKIGGHACCLFHAVSGCGFPDLIEAEDRNDGVGN